jgi:hypothetical protein
MTAIQNESWMIPGTQNKGVHTLQLLKPFVDDYGRLETSSTISHSRVTPHGEVAATTVL